MQDKEMKCTECKRPYTFTVGEQEFFQAKQFTPPKRCADCRRRNKERKEREAVAGRSYPDNGRPIY